ncbi:NAD(P)/FAD-dependent oxidoreductase [Umezawaea tangerina]|uniref:3-phenylpropionate/trans-cinnamate dioxygenase ferredoxin reductase subunit n=1 Tax=Umezawaea tangerina TaxID=84725 RepID=A0A2T0SP49_9PSEU|nr:FAD-dependent oxidoreductase [Umezawaea tangerina]PRY35188.1 3-phenylpropionate/trans-cinnamate dioxygenase ferredoxin reductase subunit [Umezawaea tangerina]
MTIVILGGGLAGAKTAEALREQGYDGDVVLVAGERHHPYERPPLSKGYLGGKDERSSFAVFPDGWYADHRVDLRTGVTATAVDREAHRVALDDGSSLDYDRLVLATGSRPRRLDVPGADSALHLRTVEDSDRLRRSFRAGGRLVVVGAGWIGLEVASIARQAGVEVTVAHSSAVPLRRAVGPEVARVFVGLHEENGVEFRFDADVVEITGSAVLLGDGSALPADHVLVAVGAVPNTELAEAAGLEVDDGVVVDATLRTSDPDVFAVGDVARAFHPVLERYLRVEHWANAASQPATVAAAILGKGASYQERPYFFTDQYDLGMEFVGTVEGYDRVVFRGDVASREFIAFWLADGVVLGGMNVNVWDVSDRIKALIGTSPNLDRLADPDVDL